MTYQHTIAKIESTRLGYEDHGIFSLTIGFSYGSAHQGFGAIGLGNNETTIAGPLIEAVLKAAGVNCWEKLKGRTVYAVRDEGYNGIVRGIAPLPTEPGRGFVLRDAVIVPYTVQE